MSTQREAVEGKTLSGKTALSAAGRSDELASLASALREKDERVREAAIKRLADLEESAREVLPAIVEAIGDSDEDVGYVAFRIVESLRPDIEASHSALWR